MKLTVLTETIAAVATALGGPLAIIRLSGPEALDIARSLFRPYGKCSFQSHRVYYGHIVHEGIILDEVMLTPMKAPKSYTREDMVEISCHGGLKAVAMVLDRILESGARLAEPGEFTKRAFLKGRIDLNQAQAVIDLINAKTELSHSQAIGRLRGGISQEIEALRDTLLGLIAGIEASIDYPEHDMEEENKQEIQPALKQIGDRLKDLLENANRGILLNQGIRTVIVGKPNVGKSSLMNVILNQERAIVTDTPGTTRDIISESINVKGIPLHIIDTAGIRDTEDRVEKLGVEKSLQYAQDADLTLFVLDGAQPMTQEDFYILEQIRHKKVIFILNKSDLSQKLPEEALLNYMKAPVVRLSAKSAAGLSDLYEAIYGLFFQDSISIENSLFISNARDKQSIDKAAAALLRAGEALAMGMTEDIVVIDLMECYSALGEITGETVDEDIIDRIFSDFCLGK